MHSRTLPQCVGFFVAQGKLSAHCQHYNCTVQVDRAWEYLQRSGEVDKPDVRYQVRVQRSDGGPVQRGIYLCNPGDIGKVHTFQCSVGPRLHEVCRSFMVSCAVPQQYSVYCYTYQGGQVLCNTVLCSDAVSQYHIQNNTLCLKGVMSQKQPYLDCNLQCVNLSWFKVSFFCKVFASFLMLCVLCCIGCLLS